MDTLGKRFHEKLLGYTYWFMSIRISQMNYFSISVDQAIYATSVIERYLDTDIFKTGKKFYKTTLLYDIIFKQVDAYTSDD